MKMSNAEERLDGISFRQLSLFETVGRIQSVRRASGECNLSQPAVTQAISKLERQLDIQLLDRRVSGSYLTELGAIFHRRVTRFFEQFHIALRKLPVSGSSAVRKATARRITRSQARSLIALVGTGSLDRAAQALDITPTSLQRAVRTLEQNVNKPIMSRTASGLSITPAGRELGVRLKIALQEIEMGWREMILAHGRTEGRVTVGAMPLGGSALLGSALEEFTNTYPNVEIKVLSGNSPELLDSLAAGDVDFVVGLVKRIPDLELEYEEFAQTPYSVVCRKGHRLLRKARITREDLVDDEWIIATKGAIRREAFELLFQDTEGPNAPIRTSALPVILHLLGNSDRLTLMTSFELMMEGRGLAQLPFGPILPVPSIGITTRTDWLPTRVQQDLMSLIRQEAARARTPELSRAS